MSKKHLSDSELEEMSPRELRGLVRRGEWRGVNVYACRGYAMANLAIVPMDYAFEFLLFCQRNPYPCPVIEVTEPGNPEPRLMAPGADLRTDLPKYRVYQNGKLVDEPNDIMKYWRNDLVAFLIGCSNSFEWSLKAANVHFRLLGAYTSNIQCVPAGRFHGPVAVTCRLFKNGHDAVRAVQISSRLLKVHGPPLHIGDPARIGIKDLSQPDIFSFNLPPQEPDEIAMFWGCGVTPQTVALESKIPFIITHAPGYMFMTDRLTEELSAF
jgi:uncharacterized protein YcsI (UPF0317 family)